MMNKENASTTLLEKPALMRLTRAQARARALGQSDGLPPLHPTVKTSLKRAASDENKPRIGTGSCLDKKRAVLKDVTNVIFENSYLNCTNATKVQSQFSNHNKKKKKSINEKKKVETEEDIVLSELSGANSSIQLTKLVHELLSPSNLEENKVYEKDECLDKLGVLDIDSKHKDPLMCATYAPAIYKNMYAMELDRRASIDYMEKLQHDITEGMRGILIDWLVEVSEEYRVVPDTLYLTVNLIDRFLSGNCVKKQKLQLLGITCMLIASKYEEFCPPRVKEFCFITDNTYTKEEVVETESKVLNFLGFQLSVPTSKKFLRRFIQAAQISYKVPSVELEFLANYLGELTLLEYSFLKFLPSLIAASAVFLARWILDPADHPWNPTLEHYTGYKTMELKNAVLALQELQLNTSGCSLSAIRQKYKQDKFKRVATLSASKPVQSLFDEAHGV